VASNGFHHRSHGMNLSIRRLVASNYPSMFFVGDCPPIVQFLARNTTLLSHPLALSQSVATSGVWPLSPHLSLVQDGGRSRD